MPAPTPSLDKVEALIRAAIGAGRAWPSCSDIAYALGWRSERSARDALHQLEARGRIRREGVEQRSDGRARIIWSLTALGAAPRVKWCRACLKDLPSSSFYYSSQSADGLAPICCRCLACMPAGRRERSARRAARMAAP
jgi:hypothetical protein